MRIETAEVSGKNDYIIHVRACETNETRVQLIQSTQITDHQTMPHHTGNIIESESISRRRCQMDLEANLGVHRHAHALVALVVAAPPGVSLDLTLHETQLQAERYA